MLAIEVKNIEKKYENGVKALYGLNLNVKYGEIFSLLGQNGAGKSTLIRILSTYTNTTSGKVKMLGMDVEKDAEIIRFQIACVAQQISLDTHLTLKENMLFQSQLYRIPKEEAKKRITKLLYEFALTSYSSYPISSFSGGIKRRADIALNLMSNPKILFLDEPTVGMDIQSRQIMWKMIKKIRDEFGTTVFLTTHYLEEANILSDTICILKDGRNVIQGTPEELRSIIQQNSIRISFNDNQKTKIAYSKIRLTFFKRKVRLNKVSIDIESLDCQSDLEEINKYLIKNSIQFSGIEIVQPTLEDAFLRLTKE